MVCSVSLFSTTHALLTAFMMIHSPGRFFAATVLKMLLAHLVTTYDVKFEEGKEPKQFFINGVLIPGRGNVLFRKRFRAPTRD